MRSVLLWAAFGCWSISLLADLLIWLDWNPAGARIIGSYWLTGGLCFAALAAAAWLYEMFAEPVRTDLLQAGLLVVSASLFLINGSLRQDGQHALLPVALSCLGLLGLGASIWPENEADGERSSISTEESL